MFACFNGKLYPNHNQGKHNYYEKDVMVSWLMKTLIRKVTVAVITLIFPQDLMLILDTFSWSRCTGKSGSIISIVGILTVNLWSVANDECFTIVHKNFYFLKYFF